MLDTVGMKPLSERDENLSYLTGGLVNSLFVGMKPLSERDENLVVGGGKDENLELCRNEATL